MAYLLQREIVYSIDEKKNYGFFNNSNKQKKMEKKIFHLILK